MAFLGDDEQAEIQAERGFTAGGEGEQAEGEPQGPSEQLLQSDRKNDSTQKPNVENDSSGKDLFYIRRINAPRTMIDLHERIDWESHDMQVFFGLADRFGTLKKFFEQCLIMINYKDRMDNYVYDYVTVDTVRDWFDRFGCRNGFDDFLKKKCFVDLLLKMKDIMVNLNLYLQKMLVLKKLLKIFKLMVDSQ